MDGPNIEQAVPFLMVADIEASLRFYIAGLGARMTKSWTPERKVRWCWLQLGCSALMLQEYNPGKIPPEKRGVGVSLCFQCQDAIALYKQFLAAGLKPKRPFVGNAMWVTILKDPDGYTLDFESPTDAPEESAYEETVTRR
jgi:lactoylglutathione lyase